MTGTRSPLDISTKLQRIAELARREPRALTALAHHIAIEFLREAYRRTRKDGATGVDGETAASYAERLDENLRSLLDRFKSGTYRAPPVRRIHIPKGDGSKTRPIGIPTFEDNPSSFQRGPCSVGAAEVQAVSSSRTSVDALVGSHRATGAQAVCPVATRP